jgi:hypothetical protein
MSKYELQDEIDFWNMRRMDALREMEMAEAQIDALEWKMAQFDNDDEE